MMRRRLTAGIAAAVVSVAMAVPATGLANKGGHPHSTSVCPAHTNKGKHKGEIKNSSKGLRKGASKGKKCGHTGTP